MVLSINDTASVPNASLMHYAIGENGMTLYFGTRIVFKKFGLLHAFPAVSCLIAEEGNDPVRAVSIHGVVRQLSGIEHELGYALFKANNTTKWYIEGADDIVMFVVEPTSVSWIDGSSGELVTTAVPLHQG